MHVQVILSLLQTVIKAVSFPTTMEPQKEIHENLHLQPLFDITSSINNHIYLEQVPCRINILLSSSG